MMSPSSLSLQITSLCRMGWCYEDSCLWTADMDRAIPADKLPEFKARLEQIPDLTDRRLAFLEALGSKRNPEAAPETLSEPQSATLGKAVVSTVSA